MVLTANFNQATLSGLEINNPTSLQFGPDGRLYVAQQNGTIKVAEVQAVTDAQGEIVGYEVVGKVEVINLVKNIPNHNDDGSLNTSVNSRQVTGLVVDQDSNGDIVLYVGSSDYRIGGGKSGNEKNLDTNSSIISRLSLTNPGASLGDSRWTKVDLVIGLPRSEENHSINGLDIRTERVDGKDHQIMYVTSGGSTNRGAPSNNFVWTPEYYYSAAVLRVDLTELEQIEATEGLKGGTSYVDKYVYALPTLNDPTRSDNAAGQDTASGTTGALDAEAGDTFGGNDGLNQAKFDPDGPVQIYSMGYRNHYDLVNTKAGNLYTVDNGPNNGWGDVPLTASGNPVTSSSQVGTNNPNVNVDTGNDTDLDNLHLVTEGFYAGHPNPVYASGAAAGLYSVDTSSGSPVVTELTDVSDANNDPTTTRDDLPSDWQTITGGQTNPEADLYLSPGKNPDGTNIGADGSLLTFGSSSNGLTEYLGSLSDNSNAEILATASFNDEITFIEIESDGTQNGTRVTDTEAIVVGGTPLDLTAVDGNGVDGNGLFGETVWVAQFGVDAIAVLTPGTPPPPDTDQDDDGLNDNVDPLQFDPANGTNTVLSGGDTLFWDFNPSDSGKNPSKGTTAEGPYNIGMTGWMINRSTPFNELVELENTIRGGAPGIVQVKSVKPGTLLGTENNQQDAIQTGFLPADSVQDFTIKIPNFNPFSSDANNGVDWSESASMGFTLGDGSMSNWLQVAVGATNPSGSSLAPVVQVTYEENDIVQTDLEVDAAELLNSVDDDLIELLLTVDLETYKATPSWRYQTNGDWSATKTIGAPVQLNVDGPLVNTLEGQSFEGGLRSAPIVTMTATSSGSAPFTADFLDLTIESTALPSPPVDSEPPAVSVNDVTVNEGAGAVAFTVSLTEASESEIVIGYETADDTATAGSDYKATSGTLTFEPGETSQTVTVDILEDSKTEDNEVFTLDLFSNQDETIVISKATGIATITDNEATADPEVLYRINVGGGAVASTDNEINWSRDTKSNPSSFRVGSGGSNTASTNAAIDISDPSLAGSVPQAIFKTGRWDPLSAPNMQWAFPVEPNEEYEVRLLLAETYSKIDQTGERVFDAAVEGSVPIAFDNIDPFAIAGQKAGFALSHTTSVEDGILNLEFWHDVNNPALKGIEILALGDAFIPPVLLIDNTRIDEDAGSATFTVNLSRAIDSEVTVDYATANGTATAGSDYETTDGTLTFEPGVTTKTITVDLLEDAVLENDETFTVQLSDANNATIADDTGVSTIVDNDEASTNPPESLDLLYRVNVGGAEIAADSLAWSADTNDNPSSFRVGSGGSDIASTGATIDTSDSSVAGVPQAIFKTERWDRSSAPPMKWEFPVQPGGDYEVRLFLAETYSKADQIGDRVFDVAVEGSVPIVFNDIDQFAEAGQKAGFALAHTVTVEDDSLSLEFSHEVDNPAIKGIEVYGVDGSSVPPDSPDDSVGEAVLEITVNNNDVQSSNYGNNSFQITNTGEKKIAQVDIDVTNALYPDSVFDPFGQAGDTVSKALTINTNGGTGVDTPSDASYIGAGGTSGYEKIRLTFDEAVNNGFENGETVGFAIDMDPNSVAGTSKDPLDAGSAPSWDVGGVSGAELIGSTFTVTFTDGTTTTGQLQGVGNQAGSQALATQDSPDLAVSLVVNGLTAGEVGTYDESGPSVIVNGPAGETARVVLTKGFIQPVDPYASFLEDQLDALAASEFPANNAVEFQTVDVQLTGNNQNITNQFDFSGVPIYDFAGEDQLPLGFVASVIAPTNNDLSLGPVTQPIYLQFDETTEPIDEPTESDVVAEYGSLSTNHQWQTVSLDNTYTNPVVIVSDPTFNGGDPVASRLRNVTSNSFDIRLQEPNYEDGYHTNESVSYLVVEAGDWTLEDGTRLSAGTYNSGRLTSAGFDTVDLTGFDTTPTVLSQVQTFRGSDWVTTRVKEQATSGFQIAMQEEEALNSGGHISETIGWLAIEPGTATDGNTLLQGRTTDRAYNSSRSTVALDASFNDTPALIAKLGSTFGSDTANLRLDTLTADSFGVRVHEEQSLDTEIGHTTELVSFLALEGQSGVLAGFEG